jgi:hypothetical protein
MIIGLVHGAMEDVSKDILQRYGANKEKLYEKFEKELKEIQEAICSVCEISTMPSSLETVELGEEPAQLQILADVTEAWIQKVKEEKEKATESMKKEKDEVLEQLRVVRYCVTAYETERDGFQ